MLVFIKLQYIFVGIWCCSSILIFAQQEEGIDWQSEACMDCHDDIPALSHKTLHNPKFKVRCEDCHTSGVEHIDDPEPSNIVTYGEAAQKQCINCHQGEVHAQGFRSESHGGAQIFCGDCHQGHKSETPPFKLLHNTTVDLCSSCHADVGMSFAKPFSHRLDHGNIDCISCHNIHPGKGLAATFDIDSRCVACHQEKRGPFVFEHVTGSAGNCLSCHEVHGSNNPMQLTRATVDQLCLECHSSQTLPTLGSQPPAIHDLRSPRYRNCTTCHEAIHGSHTSPLLLK